MPYVTIKIKNGKKTIIELYPDKAPKHVQRILELAQEGFYNGKPFHRVIDGFVVQTGCSKGDGTGGSEKPNLKQEFNDISHVTGIVSMARAGHPDSANSQFFIMLGDHSHLDYQYTAFGKVISGMEYVHDLKKANDNSSTGAVINPDCIEVMYESDAIGNTIS